MERKEAERTDAARQACGAVRVFLEGLTARLDRPPAAVWLYGSLTLGEFRPGWSDIDVLALVPGPLSAAEAERLVELRAELARLRPDAPLVRLVEGAAAERWAQERGLCPEPEVMRRALAVRDEPERFRNEPETKRWLRTLGPSVQRFEDVLEARLAPCGRTEKV